MAAISNNNIAHAIYLASKGSDKNDLPSRVVKFLSKRRLLSRAPDILMRLNKIINEDEGRVVAKVTSAKKIDEVTNKKISEALAIRYKAKEVRLMEVYDEKLLGGFRVEVDDEVIDLTIKNKIGKLQEYLTKSA